MDLTGGMMTKQEALDAIYKKLDSIIDTFAKDHKMSPDKAAALAKFHFFSGPVLKKLREELEVLYEKESKP